MNTVETYKIRKQQRSIHLLLKPEIANLCEILHLPVCSWFLFVMFYLPLFVLLWSFVHSIAIYLPAFLLVKCIYEIIKNVLFSNIDLCLHNFVDLMLSSH